MIKDREQRFQALYRESCPRIVAYALRRADSAEAAADIVSETFTVAWRRLDDIPSGDAGLLWLYVTARHLIANDQRRDRRRSELVERLGAELRRTLSPASPEEGRFTAAQLLAALEPADREVLLLATWEGLNSRELGIVIGCSPAAARIRLHRARARLAAAMGTSDRRWRPPSVEPTLKES